MAEFHWTQSKIVIVVWPLEFMTKITMKTDDGNLMVITSNDPVLKMDFPKENTRTVDIGEKFTLVSIVTQEEPLSA